MLTLRFLSFDSLRDFNLNSLYAGAEDLECSLDFSLAILYFRIHLQVEVPSQEHHSVL